MGPDGGAGIGWGQDEKFPVKFAVVLHSDAVSRSMVLVTLTVEGLMALFRERQFLGFYTCCDCKGIIRLFHGMKANTNAFKRVCFCQFPTVM